MQYYCCCDLSTFPYCFIQVCAHIYIVYIYISYTYMPCTYVNTSPTSSSSSYYFIIPSLHRFINSNVIGKVLVGAALKSRKGEDAVDCGGGNGGGGGVGGGTENKSATTTSPSPPFSDMSPTSPTLPPSSAPAPFNLFISPFHLYSAAIKVFHAVHDALNEATVRANLSSLLRLQVCYYIYVSISIYMFHSID